MPASVLHSSSQLTGQKATHVGIERKLGFWRIGRARLYSLSLKACSTCAAGHRFGRDKFTSISSHDAEV
jgi:hypothetical protein